MSSTAIKMEPIDPADIHQTDGLTSVRVKMETTIEWQDPAESGQLMLYSLQIHAYYLYS